MGFVRVAKKDELLKGEGKVVEAAGKAIALFNVDGRFYAMDNACQHRGGPLGEGDLQGNIVVCPWHGWEYDVTTGQCLTAPGKNVKYQVKVEGDEIFVDV